MIAKVVCFRTHVSLTLHDQQTFIRLKLSFSEAIALDAELQECLREVVEADSTSPHTPLHAL